MQYYNPTNTAGSPSEASDRTSSASDDVAPPLSVKKRKSTYYVRKEAIDVLHSQVERLTQELAQAQKTSKVTPHLVNAQYSAEINRNHQLIAGLAAMLSSCKQSLATTPLATFIHLPTEQHHRDNKLQSLHKPKLAAAFRFMVERTRFLNLQLKHFHEELVHEPSGDAVSVRLDIASFKRRYSLVQVYEALKFYLLHQQKILTEVTSKAEARPYKHAYDEDFQCGQVRVSSTISDGDVDVQSNSVTFLSCVETGDAAHAVAASDSVDQDDLDMRPCETNVVGEDLTSAVLVRETMTDAGAIVTISHWQHSRFRAPLEEPLSRLQIEELHSMGKRRWDVMMGVMQERLEALW